MTWDNSWKDITDLDGLKRQPYKAAYHNDLVNALCERYNVSNTEDDFITKGTLDKNSFNIFDKLNEWGALPFRQNRFMFHYPFYPFVQPYTVSEIEWYLDDNIKRDPTNLKYNDFYALGGFGTVTLDNFMTHNGYQSNIEDPFYDGYFASTSKRYITYSRHMIWFKQMLKYCKIPSFCIRYITWDNADNFIVSPLYINGNISTLPHRCRIYRTKSVFDGTLVLWATLNESDTSFIDPYYGVSGFDADYANYIYSYSFVDNRIGYLQNWQHQVHWSWGNFYAIMLVDNIAFEYI